MREGTGRGSWAAGVVKGDPVVANGPGQKMPVDRAENSESGEPAATMKLPAV